MFLAPFVFIVLTALMTDAQALSSQPLAAAVPLAATSPTCSTQAPILALHGEHDALRRARHRRRAGLERPRRLRARRGCAGAGRDAVFLLVLATMMLPAQVTIVPLYVHVVEAAPGRHAGAADHPQLVRRRVLDLPAAPVLPDDPGGVRGRRAGRRLRRAADPADGDRAAGQAGDRRRRAVQLPLLPGTTSSARCSTPARTSATGRCRSASRSSAPSTRCSGT